MDEEDEGGSDLGAFIKRLKDSPRRLSEELDNDKSLADLRMELGAVVSEGIPWSEFTEREIQAILKVHFEELGFKVTWRHNDDPANEKGIDLECYRPKDKKTILVAVKKKPKKEDLGQILQLESHEAGERIYVFVEGAAQSFRDMMGRFRSSVEFWDKELFEAKLEESGLRFVLRANNSLANKAILQIMTKLIPMLESPLLDDPPAQSPTMLDTLWALKDRATTVNKGASMIQMLFEMDRNFKDLNSSQVQDAAISCFDFIYAKALMSIKASFEEASPDFIQLLRYIYERTKARSNWGMLYSFRPGFMPGWVERTLKQDEKGSKGWEGLTEEYEKKLNEAGISFEPAPTLDRAATEFRYLSIWGYGLEATFDDMFQHQIGGIVRS